MTQTEFEHLLLQTRDEMMRVAMSFFHNREDAEDVVQEVCVRMLERGWKNGDNTYDVGASVTVTAGSLPAGAKTSYNKSTGVWS